MRLDDLVLPETEPEPLPLEARAAVAMVLGDDGHILFIQRTERDGDPWSGHMAFPGGRQHMDEPIRTTAERETWEEVALDLTKARYVGALPVQVSPVRVPTPGFGIFPFVYRVAEWPELARQEREVAAIH